MTLIIVTALKVAVLFGMYFLWLFSICMEQTVSTTQAYTDAVYRLLGVDD